MAFSSTTNTPESLSFGRDILSIIKSKTGRFIKAVSTNRNENEVLFKPGTRFKITKLYKARIPADDATKRFWSLNMDAATKIVLNKDPMGKEIKYVVIRHEVD